jgi:Ion channel
MTEYAEPATKGTIDVTESWRPGARAARLRASHQYYPVVLAIVAEFIFIAAAPDEPWAACVVVLLQGGMLFLALWTAGLSQDRRPQLPLAAIVATAAIAIIVIESGTTAGLVALLNAVLVTATIAVLAAGIVDQGEVNVKSITGAVCVYLLLGFTFHFSFGAVAALGDGSFFANGSDGTSFERLYFSFVTLATLGYGDYTAGDTVGRSLAVAEVVIGQLFLVVTVGLLVGLLVSSRVRSQQSDKEPTDLQ